MVGRRYVLGGVIECYRSSQTKVGEPTSEGVGSSRWSWKANSGSSNVSFVSGARSRGSTSSSVVLIDNGVSSGLPPCVQCEVRGLAVGVREANYCSGLGCGPT